MRNCNGRDLELELGARDNQFLSSPAGALIFSTVGAAVKFIKGSGFSIFKFHVINPFFV